MSPFKILFLPNVALQELMRCFNPIELFELSQCSLKIAEKVKLVGGKRFKLKTGYFNVEVNSCRFRIGSRRFESKYSDIDTRKFEDKVVKTVILAKADLLSFWDDRMVGLLAIFFHLSKLFNCPTNTLNSCGTLDEKGFTSVMKFIVSRQKTIQNLTICVRGLTTDDFNFMMNNLKVTEEFNIYSHIPNDFIASIGFKSPKYVIITNSSWVTLENLMAMKNAIVINLYDSSLTNQDIVQFFQEWKSGNYPKLEYLSIHSEKLDKNLKIDGLEKLEDALNRVMLMKRFLEVTRSIDGAVPIRRDDGVMGNIRFHTERSQIKFMLF